jgi:Sec-independent protein translocase protein TatA
MSSNIGWGKRIPNLAEVLGKHIREYRSMRRTDSETTVSVSELRWRRITCQKKARRGNCELSLDRSKKTRSCACASNLRAKRRIYFAPLVSVYQGNDE